MLLAERMSAGTGAASALLCGGIPQLVSEASVSAMIINGIEGRFILVMIPSSDCILKVLTPDAGPIVVANPQAQPVILIQAKNRRSSFWP